jgi:NhaA family Na+:H+ antiporter
MRRFLKDFIRLESSGGMVMLAATILALLFSNTPLLGYYHNILSLKISLHIGVLSISKSLLLWINDGLMTIFFLSVSLELKREILGGELSSFSRFCFPLYAAIGGIVVPALIYVLFNWGNAAYLSGWAIPTATDIAFSLGVLALLGRSIPLSLKLFLLTLAILDDISGISIIAIFHTSDLSWLSMGLAAAIIFFMIMMNFFRVMNLVAYSLVGLILWCCVLKSGIHATLAGVVLGFMIPIGDKTNVCTSPLMRFEQAINPWVSFLVVPLFAFANAGLTFKNIGGDTFGHPIVLGVFVGLFVGKPVGIMLFAWGAVKLGWAKRSGNCQWLDVYGVALLCGIGFTMSLFIGTLAFKDQTGYISLVQLGVLLASLMSGIFGFAILKWSVKRRECKLADKRV